MLKPVLCVVCEKVLVTKEEVASLIGLFSKIFLQYPPETQIPKDAVTPKEWCVFSSWDPEPIDEQAEYIVCTEFLYPDQSRFGELIRTKVDVQPNKRSQVVVGLNGFPVGQFGEYTIRTWVEKNQQLAVPPIEIKVGVESIIPKS